MKRGGLFSTFRAQLALPAQRQMFDYWLKSAGQNAMPSRADISPSGMARFLPHVSLIEIHRDPLDFSYRLAGTRLREIFSTEVTGLRISDFDEQQNRDYWRAACERIAHTGRPAQGVLRGPEQSRDHLVQFWMRLPLGNTDGKANMILGYDICVPVSRTKNESPVAAAADGR